MEKELDFIQKRKKRTSFIKMCLDFYLNLKTNKKLPISQVEKFTHEQADKYLLIETFSNLLSEKNISAITQMTQAGYIPQPKQNQKLAQLIRSEFIYPNYFLKTHQNLSFYLDNGLNLPPENRYDLFCLLLNQKSATKYMSLLGTDYSIQLAQELEKEKQEQNGDDESTSFALDFFSYDSPSPASLSEIAPLFSYMEKWIKQEPAFYKNVWCHFCHNIVFRHERDLLGYERDIVKLIKKLYEQFILPNWAAMNTKDRKEIIDAFNEKHEYLIKKQKEKESYLWHDELEKLNTLRTQINAISIADNTATMQPVSFDDILNKTRKLFSQQNTIITHSFTEKDLPLQAQEILNKIKQIHVYMSSNIHYLDAAQRIWVENMIDKRIPEIIKKYSAFSIEDRENLKNHEGKTPYALCIDSFSNIYSEFEQISEQIKQNHLSDFSAVNKYTRQFKH